MSSVNRLGEREGLADDRSLPDDSNERREGASSGGRRCPPAYGWVGVPIGEAEMKLSRGPSEAVFDEVGRTDCDRWCCRLRPPLDEPGALNGIRESKPLLPCCPPWTEDDALSEGLGWCERCLARPRSETLRDRSLPQPRRPGKPPPLDAAASRSLPDGEGNLSPRPLIGPFECCSDDETEAYCLRSKSSTEASDDSEGLALPLPPPRMDAAPVIEASMALPRAAIQRFISRSLVA
jgi:hypothetical protein